MMLREVLEHAANWPTCGSGLSLPNTLDEIEARRTGVYAMSDEERIAVGRVTGARPTAREFDLG